MMNAGNINDLNSGFSDFISGLTQETSVSKQMKFNGLSYFTIGKQITQNEQYSEPIYVIYAADYSNITNTFLSSCVPASAELSSQASQLKNTFERFRL